MPTAVQRDTMPSHDGPDRLLDRRLDFGGLDAVLGTERRRGMMPHRFMVAALRHGVTP
jgi:hypothetical protein